MHLHNLVLLIIFLHLSKAEKINLNTLNNYSEFLNFGEKKMKLHQNQLENSIIKSKIDVLGEIFKSNIDSLKAFNKLDLIFLIDASSSVGEKNFKNEVKFVKKFLSDVTVDFNHTRVAVITFSSPNNVVKNIDEISNPNKENNKCLLLNKELKTIKYTGGETYTLGAFKLAKEIFEKSRNDSKKILFLITDGFSTGGSPIPLANELKENQITIFTIGIQNGNYKELYEISSSPGEFHSYLLNSYREFENLARRALHVDLKSGDYLPLGTNKPCDGLCDGGNCCDSKALCSCGTSTGHYSCICEPGYYGSGFQNFCKPCPSGTYSNGPNLCLPCPDPNHTTQPATKSMQSCKCKNGYKQTSNNTCEILKCPNLDIADHSYLINDEKQCINALNSTCKIRCEVGYTLVGSGTRFCQPNATWSGVKPFCQRKTCPKLKPLQFGSITCFQNDFGEIFNHTITDFPVDTVCSFNCEEGRTLVGSSERTCLPQGFWDGLKTSCKQIKCLKLPEIQNGIIEPKSCTFGKQPIGKSCSISCDEGFEIDGPQIKTCTNKKGLWDNNLIRTFCRDSTPPIVLCPENVTIETAKGKKFGFALWDPPVVSDNFDQEVTVWMKPAINNLNEFKFEIGITKITYFAQDSFHNRAKCLFYVDVKDAEKPTIENCIDPPTFLSTDKIGGMNITWDEPNIFDNSQSVIVTKSHDFGFFPMGTTTVIYSATDSANNKNTCSLNITVEEAQCEALADPVYGHSACSSQNNGMQCVITCQEGYAVPLYQPQNSLLNDSSSISFVCQNSDSTWYNQEGLMFPDCTVTEVPKEIEQNGVVTIVSDSNICDNTNQLNELENDVKVLLHCVGDCLINTEINYCEDESDDLGETSNIIKRDVNLEKIQHKNIRKKHSKKKRINIKFQVRGKYENQTILSSYNNSVVTRNITIKYEKSRILCSSGFIPRKKRCVQCPKGTFHNSTINKCQPCDFGYYNDKLGQVQCFSCPLHHSTRKLHSKKKSECKEKCPPGFFARKRMLKPSKHQPNVTIERATLKPHCRSCPIGHYQSDYGEISCLPCPKGHTTTAVGASSISQCLSTAAEICSRYPNICNNGQCIAFNDFEYTCNCSKNYIGSHCEKLASHCDSNPCMNGGTCDWTKDSSFCACPKGYSGEYCQNVEEKCLLRCLNNGKCIQNDPNDYICLCPDGFGGDTCEIILKYCREGICENNGTCIEESNGYRCNCSKGFLGRRCNFLPCDFKPCRGNSICFNTIEDNTTKNSYKCTCSEGYTGKLCDFKIDHCLDDPCQNGGTCLNNLTSFTCICPKIFNGTKCEFKKNFNYIISFPKFSITDYIKLNGFEENLTEITACLWMQTTDNFNYGTLISYANENFDNAFTLTDYTGLVFYVNNQLIVTDILLNDGNWHHICTSWSSLNGKYEIYINAKMIKNGLNLAVGTKLQGGGKMVIGQEQDVLGGRFSQSESFIGKITYFDVWSKILNQNDIYKHMNDCQEISYGNIYSWPEIQNNIEGNIQIEKSTFCKICDYPKPLYNGRINIINNVAYYDCNKGFLISSDIYKNGRKCSKASKWEGYYEPHCRKIYCGYPGFIRNGFMIGNKYYYQENVTYACYEGYNLIGNTTITCTENGTWDPEKPYCSGLQCEAFKQPENSVLNIIAEHSYEDFIEKESTFDIGTRIEISCEDKYNLTGQNSIICAENGTWDYDPPECVLENIDSKSKMECQIDKVPPAPNNGYINLESLYAVGNGTNDTVEYKCRNGYKLLGDDSTVCIIDGYWTQSNATCTPITCIEPKFKNMLLKKNNESKDDFIFGNMAKFECVEGYRMFGDSTVRCLANGRWSRMRGKCTRKSCRKPLVSEVTIVEGNSYFFNDEVTIICSSKSRYVLKCSSSGAWEGEKDESC